MKNSVSSVLAGLDSLANVAELRAQDNQQLGALRYQSRRLSSQLMQLLSVYKLQNQSYSVNLQQWSVEELLEDVVAEHQPLLATRGIRIDYECRDDLMAYFDRELVIGVLDNVVNNAYRYAQTRISLYATSGAENSGVELIVMDDGPGYPPAMQIFPADEPAGIDFQQHRTGLGLYFSTLVANSHRHNGEQGHIACDNLGINCGGRFKLSLP